MRDSPPDSFCLPLCLYSLTHPGAMTGRDVPQRPAPAWRETVSLKQRGILGHDDDDDDDEDDDDDDDEDEDDDDEEERPVVVPVRAVSRALPWANKKVGGALLQLARWKENDRFAWPWAGLPSSCLGQACRLLVPLYLLNCSYVFLWPARMEPLVQDGGRITQSVHDRTFYCTINAIFILIKVQKKHEIRPGT